jgi:hypothetical protein
MVENNYLNIRASERDSFVYRIISIQRLFELFEEGRNVLVSPKTWEDPFENFILRSDHIYGQCWTLQSASDAMWRIYSPAGDAVRIRSTMRRLLESLIQSRVPIVQSEVYIGRVKYLNNEKLMGFAKMVFRQSSSHSSARILASTLLVKRPAFRHEREVRLLLVSQEPKRPSGDLFSYEVDPNFLIDQIMIDPRMSFSEGKSLKEKIRRTTRFHGSIKRSLLYGPPPILASPFWKSVDDLKE